MSSRQQSWRKMLVKWQGDTMFVGIVGDLYIFFPKHSLLNYRCVISMTGNTVYSIADAAFTREIINISKLIYQHFKLCLSGH